MPDRGFRISDMVWHWFAFQFSIGLHASLDDKELVRMLVCVLSKLVWMRENRFGIFGCEMFT